MVGHGVVDVVGSLIFSHDFWAAIVVIYVMKTNRIPTGFPPGRSSYTSGYVQPVAEKGSTRITQQGAVDMASALCLGISFHVPQTETFFFPRR